MVCDDQSSTSVYTILMFDIVEKYLHMTIVLYIFSTATCMVILYESVIS